MLSRDFEEIRVQKNETLMGMLKGKQIDLFRASIQFPVSLFQVEEFEAVQYFKKWYYIFYYHIQVLKDDRKLTDEISSRIAQEILEKDSFDEIEDPESRVKELLEIEISHLLIDHFYHKQTTWFKKNGFKQSDISAFLKERKSRINRIALDELSEDLRQKVETAIAYFELIDEKIKDKNLGYLPK